MTVVVIRVVYAQNIPVSVTTPKKCEGDTAMIEENRYIKKLLVVPRNKDIGNRVEYFASEVPEEGSVVSEPVRLRRNTPCPPMPPSTRPTVPVINIPRVGTR